MDIIDIRQLPDLFAWEDGDRLDFFSSEIRRRHRTFMTQRLAGHAQGEQSRAEEKQCGRSVLRSLASLPSENLAMILDAPETCHAVYRAPERGVEQLWRFLSDAILAEEIRLGKSTRGEKGVWSAAGDIYIASPNSGEADVEAMRLRGVICDLQSPFARAPIKASFFKPEFGSYETFSTAELEDVLFKCFAASECMAIALPPVWRFVESMAKTLMPRKDMANMTFKGSSNRGIIGRMNLINPHLTEVDHTVVANSMLHESIHIALYYLEEIHEFFSLEESALNELVLSPWSNNMINQRAYLHGFFVWYGLYRYWVSPSRADAGFAQDIVSHFLDFCGNGFRERAALKGMQEFSSNIRSDVMEALRDIQQRMDIILARARPDQSES